MEIKYMKVFKKVTLLLACISALLSITFIFDVYAKYATSASGDANIPIARWNISVNNVSIKNNSNISQAISPIFSGNEHIASGIIAPTAVGYFDLAFDFSQADVSFDYTISISPSNESVVTDLIATGYSIDNGTIQTFEDSRSNYFGPYKL